MTEVVPADRTRLLQSKRAECSAIARSRKRKLCILYEVAASPDSLPKRSFADPDAQPANPAESLFLEGCDILQGRKLNELNIPARPRPRPEYFARQPAPSVTLAPNENVVAAPSKQNANEIPQSTVPQPPAVAPRIGVDGLSKVASQSENLGSIKHLHSALTTQPASSPSAKPILPPSANEHLTTKTQVEEQQEKSLKDNRQVAPPQPGRGRSLPESPSNLTQSEPSQNLPSTPQNIDPPHAARPEQDRGHGMAMDIDVPSGREAPVVGPSAHPSPQLDMARTAPPDALSSPGSTAQTATTPAVLDTSTTTSPDHEGVPFVGKVEEKADGRSIERFPAPTLPRNMVLEEGSGPGLASTSENIPQKVEAQLLHDSSYAASEKAASARREASSGTSSVRLETAQLPTIHTATAGQDGKVPEVHSSGSSKDTSSGPPAVTVPAADVSNNSLPETSEKMSVDIVDNKDTISQGTRTESVALKSPVDLIRVPQQSESSSSPATPTSIVPRQLDHRTAEGVTDVALQKPVSEILGERPKPSHTDLSLSHTTPITPTSQSSKMRSRSLIQKAKAKEKSKLSTVVFGKQPSRSADATKSLVQNRSKPGQIPSDDYFTPLFVSTFASGSKWMKPLDQILHQAHKTVSTPDSYTQILDHQACRVLRRVYHLQHHDKWSLRQPKRCAEPVRQPCHWDVLLQEMKWMRTDFREERKWKMAAARNLAYACAEWVSASGEERAALQVDAVIPPLTSSNNEDIAMGDSHDLETHPTPDLIPSAESDSPLEPDDEPEDNILDTIAPSAIFALPDNDVVFSFHHSPTTDRLLEELPMYGAPLKVPKSDLIAPEYDPDASWRRPALPLSRFVESEMELTSSVPPQKRSRYHYAQEDEEDDEVVFGNDPNSQPRLEPQSPSVALFRPENKSIRDRLHAGHQFRPPNEHTMPFQTFYESRSPSQWLQSEEDELKSLVREYSYNWSLISSILSSKSVFASGAERRTPWECFERWVMLEGLPHDMQKTQYFKLWQNRIEAAQQLLKQQNQNAQQQAQQQQQQAGPNGPITPVPRRRVSLPVRVERRRNQKHLTMIDAMRKLAKKRETTAQKQQHAASLAAMRKANEAPQPRAPTKTPREYSIMRWERDQAMAERLAERMAHQQQQRQEAQRRAAAMQRAQQGQVPQMAAVPNAGQLSQNTPQMAASHPHASIARANAANQMAVNGQGRPRMPMHAAPNGTASNHMAGGLVPPMQMNGSSQVQMPVVNGQSQMAMPTPSPNLRMIMQAQQISEQQRRSVQMQQQAQQNQQGNTTLQNSPPAMRAAAINGINQKNYLNNAQAMIASFNAANANGSGMSTPPAAGLNMSAGQAGSPRPASTMPQTHQTYVSQLQQIENHIRQNSPNAPQDVVRNMATAILTNRHNNITQSAMNAAAGGPGQAAVATGPHQYAQLLRAQQQQQAAAAAQAQAQQNAQHHRNSSGSATPTPSVPK